MSGSRRRGAAMAGAVLLFIAVLVVFAVVLPARMLADEHIHWQQILAFSNRDWQVSPWLSTWPTMNFVVSLPVQLTGVRELWFGRAVMSAIAVLAMIGYGKLVAEFQAGVPDTATAAPVRALQLMTAPVVVLFAVLLYTDIPALAGLAWAAYAVLTRRRWLLLLAATATVAFRQSHIVWFVALMCWYGYEVCRVHGAFAIDRGDADGASRPLLARVQWREAASVLRNEWPVWLVAALVAIAWLAIVRSTGGVAYGASTQAGHFVHLAGLPNMCFAMVVAFLVFLPAMSAALWRQPLPSGNGRLLLLFGVGLVIAVVFQAKHGGNIHAEVQMFLRNRLLSHLNHPTGHAVMTILCLMGLMAWIAMPLAPRAQALRWPLLFFAALYVLPFGLIEQRYYIPMFALFWAMRAPLAKPVEWTQLCWGLVFSAMLLYQVAYKQRFL